MVSYAVLDKQDGYKNEEGGVCSTGLNLINRKYPATLYNQPTNRFPGLVVVCFWQITAMDNIDISNIREKLTYTYVLLPKI